MDPPSPDVVSSQPVPDAGMKMEERGKKMLHRTKAIQFLGRTTPIILQNDNGPCPLLAICNVLSLKNSLNLSPDIPEVSQEKLLSLVAERLIDSNSNIDNKDTGYVENQQQNISDAIDLLPKLTTGIDVNVQFRRIDDFEFTPECAIFDLLDIPLYHGWIVDPQDSETADAIGSKSYNALMGELVLLDTQTAQNNENETPEDDGVDFVAATTAALGIPSPSLSRGQSFDDSTHIVRKGDTEEELEFARVLKLSESEISVSPVVVSDASFHKNAPTKNSEPVKTETLLSDDIVAPRKDIPDLKSTEGHLKEDECLLSKTYEGNHSVEPISEESRYCESVVEKLILHPQSEMDNVQSGSLRQHPPSPRDFSQNISSNEHDQSGFTSMAESGEDRNIQNGFEARSPNSSTTPVCEMQGTNKLEPLILNLDTEPIYEGEEHILESANAVHENREPIYEGELIRNFIKNSGSQLTIYGLFCLQDKVKERELCVFFRNNHFNTMFKYEGELYILATDQGYIDQPDLVWEKLNEVNGDTSFMTGNFTEFKMDDQSSSSWDALNTLSSTVDYVTSVEGTDHEHSSFNTDMQLALALQQQEFEQQPEQRPQHSLQQPDACGNSRLVTGPQIARSSGKYATTSPSSKQESKSKDKCRVM